MGTPTQQGAQAIPGALGSSLARPRARFDLGALLLLGACLPSEPSAPPRYPELPRAPARHSQFSPDPSLRRVELACRAQELAEANGIDDNCDGVIDAAPPAATELTITLASPADSLGGVRLELTPVADLADAGASSAPPPLAAQPGANTSPAIQLARFDLPALAQGRYTLTLSRQGADAGSSELSLAVGLAVGGSAQTYLVRLGAEGTRTLGAIEVH